MEKGKFITIQIHNSKFYKEKKCEKIFAVRIAKFKPEDFKICSNLSPSSKLLFKCKEIEKQGKWNKKRFNSYYLPNFLEELKNNNDSKKDFFQIIQKLKNGEDVIFACYCKDKELCHRKIVAKLVEKQGYEVEIN